MQEQTHHRQDHNRTATRSSSPLYFHIGLPKTGTTFLQREVFPKWRGVAYIDGDSKSDTLKSLLLGDFEKPVLISREWMAKDLILRNLSELFPNSRLIIGFRKHYPRILSSYNQQIVGVPASSLPFEKFFDIENAEHREKPNLNYSKRIEFIERHFDHEPFVFLQEELSNNLEGLLKDLQAYIGGTSPDPSEVKKVLSNKALGYSQLQVIRRINRLFTSPRGSKGVLPYSPFTWQMRRLLMKTVRYTIPSGTDLSSAMTDEHRRAISEYYADDWSYVVRYISNSRSRQIFDCNMYQ